MTTRKLLILTGVFLALLAFVVFWERHQPTSEEKARSNKRLFDLDAKEVASLSIERPDQQPVALSRKDGRWVLEGPKGGAADAMTADGLVSDLARLDLLGEARSKFDPEGVRPRRAEGEGNLEDEGRLLPDRSLRRGDSWRRRDGRRRGRAARVGEVRPDRPADEALRRVPVEESRRRLHGRDHARHRRPRPEPGRRGP